MSMRKFVDKIPVVRHIARIVDPEGYSEESVAPEDVPEEPTVVEKFFERQRLFEKILAESPYWKNLSDKERRTVLNKISSNKDAFLSVVSKDPVLKRYWDNLQDEEKEKVINKLYSPLEKPLREPYLDPTTWGPVGLVRGVVTKSADKALRAVGQVAVGDIAGEGARQLYEGATGKEAPWWVGLAGDIGSGYADVAVKGVRKLVKPSVSVKGGRESPSISLEEYEEAANRFAVGLYPKRYTKEEWAKEFAEPIKTPIGEVRMGDWQYVKMLDERRRDLMPAIKLTLQDPLLIVKDEDAVIFLKPFVVKKNGAKNIEFISVKKEINGENIIVSNHPITSTKLKRLLDKEVLYKNAAAFRSAGGHPPAPPDNNINPPDDTINLYAGGPSTRQVLRASKELLEGSKDPIEGAKKVLEEAVDSAQLSRLGQKAYWLRWILPQYEWMKQHPKTAELYRAGKEYTEGLEKDLTQWLDSKLGKLKGLYKDLTEKERELLVDYIEGKVKDVPEKIKEVAKPTREYLDEIYNFLKDRGLNVSYRENYFPHLFEGNIRVQIGDEFYSAKTWDEALEKALEGIRQGKKVKIKAMLDPNIYDVRITNKRFWALLNKLSDGVEIDAEELKPLLKEAGIGRRPRYRFVGNLLERKYNIGGYIKDPETALELYTFSMIKKLHQDKFLKEYERVYQTLPEPQLREVLEDYKGTLLGYPTKVEKTIAGILNTFLKTRPGRVLLKALRQSVGKEINPYDIRRNVGRANLVFNYIYDLGFSASSALINSLQFIQNVAPVLGKDSLTEGTKYLAKFARGDEKVKKELFEAGILTELGFEGMRSKTKTIMEAPLFTFKAVELGNRIATYGSAKAYGRKHGVKGMLKVLDVLGVSKDDPLVALLKDKKVPMEEKLMRFASEVVDKTQFRYEKFNSPRILSGSIGKILLPYKNYLINQMMLNARMATRNAIKHPREAMQFFLTAMAIGGVAGSPILFYGYEIANKLYEERFGKRFEDEIGNEYIKRFIRGGLPMLAGIDIRSSVKLDLPTSPQELLGRPARLAVYWDEPEKFEREIKPRIWRNVEDALNMYRSGYVKDSKGRIIKEASGWDVFLRLIGVRPREFYEFAEKKGLIRDLEAEFRKEYTSLLNDLADALVDGDRKRADEIRKKIRSEMNKLARKIKNSEGEVRDRYRYMLLRLHSALSEAGIKRRVRERVAPFSSDKKKFMLVQ